MYIIVFFAILILLLAFRAPIFGEKISLKQFGIALSLGVMLSIPLAVIHFLISSSAFPLTPLIQETIRFLVVIFAWKVGANKSIYAASISIGQAFLISFYEKSEFLISSEETHSIIFSIISYFLLSIISYRVYKTNENYRIIMSLLIMIILSYLYYILISALFTN